MEYQEYLKQKNDKRFKGSSQITDIDLGNQLFDYQEYIVRKALDKGRYAIFADTGLGKTAMFLQWAKNIPGKVLILSPLGPTAQTVREGVKFGVDVVQSRTGNIDAKITVTNYELLDKFDCSEYMGVVLDESSILKNVDGKTRANIENTFDHVPYKLCCTATPAPNDLIEIVNHATFLGIANVKQLRALYFITADSTSYKWRLKKHSEKDFWEFVASWASCIRKPSDLGFDDSGYELPELVNHTHELTSDIEDSQEEGTLFALPAIGLKKQNEAKRQTLTDRCKMVADIVNASDEQWIVWCYRNDESQLLKKLIPKGVEIKGADKPQYKEDSILDFVDGKSSVIISKPSIFGFGLNLQNCHNQIFCGVSHSFEQTYQAVRRSWRYGQDRPVNIHYVLHDTEWDIWNNLKRKEKDFDKMMSKITAHFREHFNVEGFKYETESTKTDNFTAYIGDCMEVIDDIETASIGHTVFSPPFPAMYAYSDSARDVGNTDSVSDIVDNLSYLFSKDKLMRVLMPGRICAIHITQPTVFKSQEGWIGRHDFRGALITMLSGHGWHFQGDITIDKNPQYKAQRTKERGLLFKTLSTDSSMSIPCVPDYMLLFRAPGENIAPIMSGISPKYGDASKGWITQEEWIEWAAPVWYRQFPGSPYKGIMEGDVLNVTNARDEKDERHLCPLQLGVIERAIKLWSNPGETIFSPFMGIGSEGYQALKLKRKYIGIELKRSYYTEACKNLALAEKSGDQLELAV
jgi:superfamily II DNA or RNA helicase